MNEKYQRALKIGRETMNIHPYGSPEYELGRKCFAFAAERILEERKVELVFPPKIGSLEEKIQFDTEQPDYWLD